MGFFSIKKKTTPASTPSIAIHHSASPVHTPKAYASPRLASAPTVIIEPVRPTCQLQVALHHARGAHELIWIEVDPEEDVEAIRRAICLRIGDIALGIFKVAIPSDAFSQASEYTRRYKDTIDIISHFPSYSLDDPHQIRRSLGPNGWQTQLPPSLRIKDWFPSPSANSDIISILARPSHASSSSSSSRPLTLLAHFAAPTEGRSISSPSLGGPSRSHRRLPTPVDILPTSSVAELKAALLSADDRAVDKLDKVVLWRVEMSEEEMVVIEQRGGLKSGQMPWPYPPTAQVPTAMSNDHLPVSHYFPDYHSNTSLVSLSVWIHPSAHHALDRIAPVESLEAPPFRYPMEFPIVPPPEIRRASASHSLPADSPPLDADVSLRAETLPARVAGRSRRARPSTAPDSITPSTFGSGLRSIRARSPLVRPPAPVHDVEMKGLGIAGSELPPISTQGRQVDNVDAEMTKLSLKVDMGESAAVLLNAPEQDGKIIWQPAVALGQLRRSETQSRGIRSFANNRSLRAYEIC